MPANQTHMTLKKQYVLRVGCAVAVLWCLTGGVARFCVQEEFLAESIQVLTTTRQNIATAHEVLSQYLVRHNRLWPGVFWLRGLALTGPVLLGLPRGMTGRERCPCRHRGQRRTGCGPKVGR